MLCLVIVCLMSCAFDSIVSWPISGRDRWEQVRNNTGFLGHAFLYQNIWEGWISRISFCLIKPYWQNNVGEFFRILSYYYLGCSKLSILMEKPFYKHALAHALPMVSRASSMGLTY
ncbi:hypothetical protein LINPERHAP1_LOCUS13585 [Linum perenne]